MYKKTPASYTMSKTRNEDWLNAIMKTLEHIRKKQDSLHIYHKVPILPEDIKVRGLVSNTQCPNFGL